MGPAGQPPASQVSGCQRLLSTGGAALGQARAGARGKEKGRPRPHDACHEFQVGPTSWGAWAPAVTAKLKQRPRGASPAQGTRQGCPDAQRWRQVLA